MRVLMDGLSELEEGGSARVVALGGTSQVSLYSLFGSDVIRVVLPLTSKSNFFALTVLCCLCFVVFIRVLWSDPDSVSYCFDSL